MGRPFVVYPDREDELSQQPPSGPNRRASVEWGAQLTVPMSLDAPVADAAGRGEDALQHFYVYCEQEERKIQALMKLCDVSAFNSASKACIIVGSARKAQWLASAVAALNPDWNARHTVAAHGLMAPQDRLASYRSFVSGSARQLIVDGDAFQRLSSVLTGNSILRVHYDLPEGPEQYQHLSALHSGSSNRYRWRKTTLINLVSQDEVQVLRQIQDSTPIIPLPSSVSVA